MRSGLWIATGIAFVLLLGAVGLRLVTGMIQIGLTLALLAIVVGFFLFLARRAKRSG